MLRTQTTPNPKNCECKFHRFAGVSIFNDTRGSSQTRGTFVLLQQELSMRKIDREEVNEATKKQYDF